ncbi:MAG: sugar ABC transporter permease [Lachnospiraceae bacterium]|nr:sugar ABC transporter permease [Lachnospiraceae bacterium]
MEIRTIVRKHSLLVSLFALFVFFALITEGRILAPQNMSNLVLQNSYVLIMACGMLLCILTGGNVDLSVGAVVCLIAATAAKLLESGMGSIPVILLCLLLSAIVGAWQGFWIGYMRIPSFICTLAGMFMFRGFGREILDSQTVIINDRAFFDIFTAYIAFPVIDSGDVKWSAMLVGCIISILVAATVMSARSRRIRKGYERPSLKNEIIKVIMIDALILAYTWKIAHFRGISVMLIWVIAVVGFYQYLTTKSLTGRYLYAVGGNARTAELSGIDTAKIYFLAYTSMGLLAGLSALMVAARVGSVNGDIGNSFEMDAIGACFIGGASAAGGSGTVVGAVIGGLLLGVINQGMSIIGLGNNWQYVVKGAILMFAVMFDIVSNRRLSKAS